jgi:hypothetical protein
MGRHLRLISIALSMLALSACFEEHNSNYLGSGGQPGPGGAPPSGTQNTIPTISGAPPTVVLEGEIYEFTPSASDADGDTLQFSIARKPAWADFDRQTGRISGTPTSADVGNFTNISITVSDGAANAALTAFDITVDPIAFGSATLTWMPPTENSDGTTLTDLAGYRIYYGRNERDLRRSVVVSNPGLTSYVIENLQPAIWHFAMTSVNAGGVESARTGTVSKPIS